jgi:hypothetical protein
VPLLTLPILAVCDPRLVRVPRLVGDSAGAGAGRRLGIVLVVRRDLRLRLLGNLVVVLPEELRVRIFRLLFVLDGLAHRNALFHDQLLGGERLLGLLVGLLLRFGRLRLRFGFGFALVLGLLAIGLLVLRLSGRLVLLVQCRTLRGFRGVGHGQRLGNVVRRVDRDLQALISRLDVTPHAFGEAPEVQALFHPVRGSFRTSAAQQMHQHRGRYPKKQRDVRVARHGQAAPGRSRKLTPRVPGSNSA